MSKFIRIKSPGELLDAIERKPFRFFILLNYGAWSVNRRIFYVQGLPAIAALAAVVLSL